MILNALFIVVLAYNTALQNERAQYYGIESISQINSSCVAISSTRSVGGLFLRGRLSGAEVALLTWIGPIGCWNVTTLSKYFIEIVVLSSRPLDTDFKLQCMEFNNQNRITSDNATIEATLTHPLIGAWKGSGKLFTRFQPQHCRGNSGQFCSQSTSLQRFGAYSWKWLSPVSRIIQMRKGTKTCIVGASHARVLVKALSPLSTVPVKEITAKYPHDLMKDFKSNECGVFIVGIGQWPAGWPKGRPYLLEEYRVAMTAALAAMVKNVEPIPVLVRSVHPNPLGDKITQCPPKDWRNPLVIEGYNKLLPAVCHKTGARFVDSSSLIVMPLWDSADDWCHYHGQVAVAEAEFFSFLLGTSKKG